MHISLLMNDVYENEASDTGWKGGSVNDFKSRDFIPDYGLVDVGKLACGPLALGLATKYLRHAKNIKYRYHKDYDTSIKTSGITSRHAKILKIHLDAQFIADF